MQKMHREDYDLICRARKQFVSLEEGVPRKPSKLPSVVGLHLRSVSHHTKNEVTREKENDAYMYVSAGYFNKCNFV